MSKPDVSGADYYDMKVSRAAASGKAINETRVCAARYATCNCQCC